MKKLLRRLAVPLLLLLPMTACTSPQLCFAEGLCLLPGPDATP